MYSAAIRSYVRAVYDLQKLRIQMSNRIVANFKEKIGQKPGMSEKELEKWAKTLLTDLRTQFKKISDALPIKVEEFTGEGLITEYAEFALLKQFSKMESEEDELFHQMENILKPIPIYSEFLKNVRGIGPALAGVIISELDPHQAKYPSSFWKYAGLDTVQVWEKVNESDVGPKKLADLEGEENVEFSDDYTEAMVKGVLYRRTSSEGRSRRDYHLVNREYKPKDWKEGQELAIRRSITFNPFLKTKLLGVMGSSFLRASSVRVDNKLMGGERRLELAKTYGFNEKLYKTPEEVRQGVLATLQAEGHTIVHDGSPYQKMYVDYKHRLNNNPAHSGKSDMHKHNMAIRYMVKRFLVDLHITWRRLEGLPVHDEYAVAKLGLRHGQEAA